MTGTYRVAGVEVDRISALWAALLVNVYLLSVGLYYLFSSNAMRSPGVVLVPLVWLSVGVWALVATRAPPASRGRRALAGSVAIAYLALLGYAGGLWGGGLAAAPETVRLELFGVPPGWAPALIVVTDWIQLALIPFKLVGYLALAYLVYATVLDAAGSAVTGLLGLFSCVSCTWPIVAGVLTGFLGGGTALAAAAADYQSYLLSTVVFVATVALLYWRPGWN